MIEHYPFKNSLLEQTCFIRKKEISSRLQYLRMPGFQVALLDASYLPGEDFLYFSSLLSQEERHKAARFRFKKDRRVFVAARGLVRMLAAEYLGLSNDEITIGYGRYGKPFLKNFEKNLQFNLSHSGFRIAVAMHPGREEVGVDIELPNNKFDFTAVVEHYFTPNEKALIKTQEDFYRFWTMKEALLKVTGVGLVDEINRLDLSAEENVIEVQEERLAFCKNHRYTLHTIDHEEYILTLACEQTSTHLQAAESGFGNGSAVTHVAFA